MTDFKLKFATFFSVVWPFGLMPFAPGTITSLFAVFIGFLINVYIGSDITMLLAILSGVLGWFTTNIYIKNNNKQDPSEVVIDEFSGQLIATAAAGTSPFFNIIALILFRIFDILKPGLIKQVENLDGATGIMMDDWIAGFVSACIIVIFSTLGLIEYKWFTI